MKDIKKYIKKIQEIWTVPRWNSAIKLGLYFIFFIIVINALKLSINTPYEEYEYKKPVKEQTIIDKYGAIERYNSNIVFDEKEYIYVVDTNKFVTYNELTFILNDGIFKYHFEEDKLKDPELNNAPKVSINIWAFTPKYISELLKDAKLSKKLSTFEGDIETISSTYDVSLIKFLEKYNTEVNMNEVEEDVIPITVIEKEGSIIGIDIDLTNFSKYIDGKTKPLKLSISYF